MKYDAIHATTLLALRREVAAAGSGGVHVGSNILALLIEAYMERAALIVVNDKMEKQGAEIAPYWAHHMMARKLADAKCELLTLGNTRACRERPSEFPITEYCPACYAHVWYESQHKHKAQRFRDGMPKKGWK